MRARAIAAAAILLVAVGVPPRRAAAKEENREKIRLRYLYKKGDVSAFDVVTTMDVPASGSGLAGLPPPQRDAKFLVTIVEDVKDGVATLRSRSQSKAPGAVPAPMMRIKMDGVGRILGFDDEDPWVQKDAQTKALMRDWVKTLGALVELPREEVVPGHVWHSRISVSLPVPGLPLRFSGKLSHKLVRIETLGGRRIARLKINGSFAGGGTVLFGDGKIPPTMEIAFVGDFDVAKGDYAHHEVRFSLEMTTPVGDVAFNMRVTSRSIDPNRVPLALLSAVKAEPTQPRLPGELPMGRPLTP